MEAKLFGALPVGLHAEHGLWSRPPDSASEWSSHCEPSSDWREAVRPVLEHFTAHTPGAFVEEKTASLACMALPHGRAGARRPPSTGARAPPAGTPCDAPVEVIAGPRVIELRPGA